MATQVSIYNMAAVHLGREPTFVGPQSAPSLRGPALKHDVRIDAAEAHGAHPCAEQAVPRPGLRFPGRAQQSVVTSQFGVRRLTARRGRHDLRLEDKRLVQVFPALPQARAGFRLLDA